MQCKICLEKYDHSKRKPYCLIPCAHSFCISCLNKLTILTCPNCNSSSTDKSPNWDLIELVPESRYDKIKQELEQNLNEANELKKELNKLREVKEAENSNKLELLQEEINSKSDHLINLIQFNRERLINQTKNIEDYLNKKLNETKINYQTDSKFKETEICLETNELNETGLSNLSNEINSKKFDFQNKIDQLSKLENEFEIFTNDAIDINIGEISNKSWIKNPGTAIEFINQGKAYQEQLKIYTKALDFYDKSLELNPKNAIPYRNKGLIYFDLKDYKLAIECYDKAIELDPSNKNAFIGKSNVLKAQKNYQEAIDCYDKVIDIDPIYTFAFYSKGIVFKEQKKYDEAIECFNKTIEINKNYTNAYYSKGLIYKDLKDYLAAIELFDNVISIDSFYINAYLSKGIALKELLKYSEAILSLDKALEIEPSFTVASNVKMSILKLVDQEIKEP